MIAVIAAGTFREVLRDRLWLVLLGFGCRAARPSKILTPLALGEGPRITVDLGLGALAASASLVVVRGGRQAWCTRRSTGAPCTWCWRAR